MNAVDIIVLVVLGVAFATALGVVVYKKLTKKGGCSGCDGCCPGGCEHCKNGK